MRSSAILVVLAASFVAGCSAGPSAATPTSALVEPMDASAPTDAPAGVEAAPPSTVPSSTLGAGVAPPATSPSTGETPPDAVLPEGFDRVRATVTAADGTECELCLWLAATADQRSRGLMFVTDLGPADGMAFVYPAPHTGNFWMKNTVLPLSIAFFDADGDHLDEFDMEPCTAEPCDVYPTPRAFVVAIETVRDGLPALGIGPGSVLELTDLPCDR